jgi:hypothetical protein
MRLSQSGNAREGTFYDPRLNDAGRFPIAARAGFGNVRNNPDLITPKLAALHFYQLAIPAPESPRVPTHFWSPGGHRAVIFGREGKSGI